MTSRNLFATGLAAISLIAAHSAASAAAPDMKEAVKLTQLNIMLELTGHACLKTADDFSAEYGRFSKIHEQELHDAEYQLGFELGKTFGRDDGGRALDHLVAAMEGEYGQGHPWLTCGQLKRATANLAASEGREPLDEAADQLLISMTSEPLADDIATT